jgi:hypothetical protein
MIIIRWLTFSAVRFTDFVAVPTDSSDKSPGYFQSSAERAQNRQAGMVPE